MNKSTNAKAPPVSRGDRLIRPGVVLAGWALLIWWRGVPVDREQILAGIVISLAVLSLGRTDRTLGRLVADWLPLAAVLVAYDFSRGAVDALGMPTQVQLPITIDKFLFGGKVPTVELQAWLQPDGPARWWEPVISVIYVSHFVVPFATAAWFWTRSQKLFRRYRNQLVALTAAALVTFAALPTAPPWLAALLGELPPVTRSAARGWEPIGLGFAGELLDKGQASVNLVAAVPSLHAAYAVLVAVALWPFAGRARPLLVAYPLAMGFVLVATGEHYVFDVALGALYVAVIQVASRRFFPVRTPPANTDAAETLSQFGCDSNCDSCDHGELPALVDTLTGD